MNQQSNTAAFAAEPAAPSIPADPSDLVVPFKGEGDLCPQPRKVLAHLRKGHTINSAQANRLFGISILPKVIFDIRKLVRAAGYDVTMKIAQAGYNNLRVTTYTLVRKDTVQ